MQEKVFRNDPARHRSAAGPLAMQGVALLLLAALLSGCAANVNDVLWEARDGDPQYVEEAVDRLGELLAAKEAGGKGFDRGDLAAIAYLRDVGEKGAEPTLRARAVSALSDLRTVDLAEYLVGRLDDEFWPVRLEAARGLALQPSPAAGATLAARLRTEPRPEVRVNLIRALAASGGEIALKALLEVLIDPYGTFKLQAFDAVRSMSGKDFDLEAKLDWSEYYQERFGRRNAPLTSDRAESFPHETPATPLESR